MAKPDQQLRQRIIDRIKLNKYGCWIPEGEGIFGNPPQMIVRRNGVAIYPFMVRVVYEEFVGPIPNMVRLLQTCNNEECVNWEHVRLSSVYSTPKKAARGR
jgi:hypothetical protein